MADNSQKTPLAYSLQRFTQAKVLDAIQQLGKALPASVVSINNQIVTVKFEVNAAPFTLPNVTVPLAGPQYARPPTQVGDYGVVFPADARLGGINGLGSGVASLTAPANLSALVFFPIGNATWTATPDANAYVLYGPNGVILRDTDNHSSLVLDPNNVTITAQTTITLQVGGHSIVIDSSGVTIDGKAFLTHVHTGVTVGSGDTGPVL
jgi:hypothetical protein